MASCLLGDLRRTSTVDRYRNFFKTGHDGTAVAFSADGSVTYIATDRDVVRALKTDASLEPQLWHASVGDSNPCDIVVSPDGLSVCQNRFYNFSIKVNIAFNPYRS